MKILVNTSNLRFGGAVQGAVSFINECKSFPEHEYHVLLGEGPSKNILTEEFPKNFTFYRVNLGKIHLYQIPSISRKLDKYYQRILPDCVISSSGPSYWHTEVPQIMGYNLCNYIYTDSPFLKSRSLYRKIRWYLKRKIHSHYFKRDGNAFYVQTNDVKQRTSKLLDTQDIYTISNTYSNFFRSPENHPDRLPQKTQEVKRLITISAYYYHKNIEIIPEVIQELVKRGRNDFQFVLTIDQNNFNSLFKDIDPKYAVTVGAVKPNEAASLYNECDFMFLPTLVECFSASYPEAMVLEKPIITTDLSFAKDICGDAAIYYSAVSPSSAADAIEKVLDSEALQQSLIENGLKQVLKFNNAHERAEKILDLCKKYTNNV